MIRHLCLFVTNTDFANVIEKSCYNSYFHITAVPNWVICVNTRRVARLILSQLAEIIGPAKILKCLLIWKYGTWTRTNNLKSEMQIIYKTNGDDRGTHRLATWVLDEGIPGSIPCSTNLGKWTFVNWFWSECPGENSVALVLRVQRIN